MPSDLVQSGFLVVRRLTEGPFVPVYCFDWGVGAYSSGAGQGRQPVVTRCSDGEELQREDLPPKQRAGALG